MSDPKYILRRGVNYSKRRLLFATVGRKKFTGNGYLAGEFPYGITTVEGAPVSATVRILYRPKTGTLYDGVVVAEVQSEPNGSWQVTGLNPDLRYDVVGRLAGRNDVVMANVKPMRTDMITYEGELVPNEKFDGVVGFITLLDGLLPFTVQGVSNFPAGLTASIVDRRRLIIDGVTNNGGEWNTEITVQDANNNTLIIPVYILIGFDAPSNLASSYNEVENTLTITWTSNSYIEEAFYIYRSDTPLDFDNLPPPIGSVGKGVTEFVDDTVVFEGVYYYAVAAVRADKLKLSEQRIFSATNASFDTLMTRLAPISWWKMQELSGSTAVDETGYKNGQYHGSPALGSPALRKMSAGSVGFLSGAQQCYVGPNEAYGNLFAQGRDATIAFWYKHVDSNGQNRVIQYFFDTYAGTSAWRIIFQYYFQTPDNQTKLVIPSKMTDGAPHFIVIVRDSIGYKLYVDGVLEASNPTLEAATGVSGYGLAFPAAGGYSHYPVRCYMSDVAIFNKAISGEDISSLYLAGKLS